MERKTSDSLLAPFRALDLTDGKGFLCGRVLGDFGADVIKIEQPGGDPGRAVAPSTTTLPSREEPLLDGLQRQQARGHSEHRGG